MIVCSNCKHVNLAGAVFCAECGSQLVGKDGFTTQKISDDEARDLKVKIDREDRYQASPSNEAWVSLYLMETGQVIALSERNEFTMGRVSEGQPIMPDIDLSPYQGYAAGVSRLHAVIKRSGPQLIFMDLGSANGSYLNGERLRPIRDEPSGRGVCLSCIASPYTRQHRG